MTIPRAAIPPQQAAWSPAPAPVMKTLPHPINHIRDLRRIREPSAPAPGTMGNHEIAAPHPGLQDNADATGDEAAVTGATAQ